MAQLQWQGVACTCRVMAGVPIIWEAVKKGLEDKAGLPCTAHTSNAACLVVISGNMVRFFTK